MVCWVIKWNQLVRNISDSILKLILHLHGLPPGELWNTELSADQRTPITSFSWVRSPQCFCYLTLAPKPLSIWSLLLSMQHSHCFQNRGVEGTGIHLFCCCPKPLFVYSSSLLNSQNQHWTCLPHFFGYQQLWLWGAALHTWPFHKIMLSSH